VTRWRKNKVQKEPKKGHSKYGETESVDNHSNPGWGEGRGDSVGRRKGKKE